MINQSRALSTISLVAFVLAGIGFASYRATAGGQVQSSAIELPKTPPAELLSALVGCVNSGNQPELEKFRSNFSNPDEHKVEALPSTTDRRIRSQKGGNPLPRSSP
jgi:hypothetical protein